MASDENSHMGTLLEGEYHTADEDDEYQDCDGGMNMFMSRLSIESFDADEEFSNDVSSESDHEDPAGCYSIPETPLQRRSHGGGMVSHQRVKEYASENEAQKGKSKKNLIRKKSCVSVREKWVDGDDNINNNNVGLVVITRPKGGKRALCMDLEEVKACKDLGFELEHERMLEMPCRGSPLSGSTPSSGGNSPIANWRISSPGDDPRDVKARLKLWAQAVALASASKQGCF